MNVDYGHYVIIRRHESVFIWHGERGSNFNCKRATSLATRKQENNNAGAVPTNVHFNYNKRLRVSRRGHLGRGRTLGLVSV